MLLTDLAARRRVLFFGGKGGVGKTTIAAAVAVARAQAGATVLLISTDPAHSLGHLFDMTIGDRATQVVPGLDACELDPDLTMDTHLAAAERTMRRLMPDHLGDEVAKHLQLARAAPGAAEAAVLERLADLVVGAEEVYDLVVVDTAPSGHTVRLLDLPHTVSAWTEDLLRRQEKSQRFERAVSNLDRGRRGHDPGADVMPQTGRSRSRRGRTRLFDTGSAKAARDAEIRDILLRRQSRFDRLRSTMTDVHSSSFVIVCVAERLPVLETIELHSHLQGMKCAVEAVVINRRSPVSDGPILTARREQEDLHLHLLHKALPECPTLEVPLLPHEPHGSAGLAGVIASL